ncbi:histidinol-phosphate transaminase [Haloferax mediterranei ATCC 33500]|uniref:Histidinol-phosphate aminotransferase n=1 Tax=Haloferax mediterranei (strain ATCC 33500 / DSM 1411 / JCM 8866 / NBRC 14739 / NCIMB 2177 / R-4) TaxID=523841 RepID=I3R4B1_HALMT|nr:histidinol-phosphate transaminase [Haloferax mediterranei]AFK19071.1 histidinol-phosphate aminotransferase [Haloferax mediterranei ATCC 33500]AHZ21569.1 histidinol-phosphate aminotransferase [Haloferax mediterranei ATCC 33500]EMA04032.1 histidinol-phosphate aminotransferase [Haloferax mediterranei ATCC 33500]MDX5989163.1 histidinol-phosphate transaminase [Haloferax mediterranei ATCC 33500]QCQ75544.1 histidinol-phosphate transaminase [Haloferax mediterranei ATCC 33500]
MQPRDLSAHTPYVPGRGTEEVARELGMDPEDLTKLSSNENPHGPSPKAIEAIEDAAPTVSVYPKTAHTDLTEALADKWDLESEQVWVSPGADGSIDYLTRAMLEPDDEILEPSPGFSYYSMSARYHHGDAAQYEVSKGDDFEQSADLVLDAYDGERMVYLTTPHNPSGSVIPRDELVELAESVDDHTLIVVDEAYGEFADEPSAIDLLSEYDNIAVMRTFSKAYGLAGLRIGYACVPEAWADAYARVNTPFAASELACRAALAALEDEEHVEKTVESVEWARDYLRTELDVPTWESAGNFVLAEVGDASAVSQAAQREGVIVRDCGSFGLPECIRISCGTEAQTKRAVEVLNQVVSEVPTA